MLKEIRNNFLFNKLEKILKKMMNKTYTGVPIWSEHVSETQIPLFSEPTYTDDKNMEIDDLEIVDYPYIGIGKKPANGHIPTEEQLERIIGG